MPLLNTVQYYRIDRVTSASDTVYDMASNDYYGLSAHPRVRAAATEALERYGVGAGASRVVTGTCEEHHRVEHTLARWHGFPAALTFSSGYLANLAVLTTFLDPTSLVISDKRNHASLIDGIRLAGCTNKHILDLLHPEGREQAEQILRSAAQHSSFRGQRPDGTYDAVIICETIDSATGARLPLPDIARCAHRGRALLIVDNAHGVGYTGHYRDILGSETGEGPDIISTCTLSKALASQGGAVLCTAQQREQLVNRARPFIFDTALSPVAAAAAQAAADIISSDPQKGERLLSRSTLLWSALHEEYCRQCGRSKDNTGSTEICPWLPPQPQSGVILLTLGQPDIAVRWAEECARQGVAVSCFRPPSVPVSLSGLRLAVKSVWSAEACREIARRIVQAYCASIGEETPA